MAPEDPVSYLTLQPGTEVISADGQSVGVVQHVLADEAADIFDGIVIDVRQGVGAGGLHFVDAPEVAELRESAVVLSISAAAVERLPKPEANPAVIEHNAAEDSDSPLQQKLRRAWDMITGRY